METKHTPQAQRIKDFIHFTGMTHTEFGRQCGFKSTRTVQSIYTEGKTPTDKALSKIVSRFPQLNYDWVLMGIGEMINPSFNENISPNSNLKSTKSGFQQIQKKLASHDLNLNDLSVDLEKMIKSSETNMLVYTQSMAVLTNKIEGMNNIIRDAMNEAYEVNKRVVKNTAQMSIDAEKRSKVFFKKLDQENEENKAYIDKLDKQRTAKNEAAYNRLSIKIRNYLKETRDLQEQLIEQKINEGIDKLNHEMHKNAIAQTDFAIKSLLDKFSVKKLLPKLGAHKRVGKD